MSEKREFAGWWLWVLLLLVIAVVVFTGLRAIGFIGGTILERKVFEQSYQKSSADKRKEKTFRATAAELERQLRRNDLTAAARADFEAQLAGVRVQLSQNGE